MKRSISILIMLAIISSSFPGLLIITPTEVLAQHTHHDPIYIEGDEDFAFHAANESWPGDGTEGDPYIIQDYEFNTSEQAITIRYTTVHFIIKNVRIINESTPWHWGIYLRGVGNGTISECNISIFGYGIYLVDSNNISIIKNEITSMDYNTIALYRTNTTTLDNNTLIGKGIYIDGEIAENWKSHTISQSNTLNGKPIYYWKDRTGGEVPKGAGPIYLINCSNVTVTGQDMASSSVGIILHSSENNTISNNNLTLDDDHGIALINSHNNNIFSNRISMTLWSYSAISLRHSNENSLMNNTISGGYYGIYMYNSMKNIAENNRMKENGINIQGETNDHYESNIIDTSNTVNEKPIHFWKGRTSGTFSQETGQLILANCSNIVIENLDIANTTIPLEIHFSDDIILRNNKIQSNNIGHGIHFFKSNNCEIYNNQLYNHTYAMTFDYSNAINIFSNNISDCNSAIKTDYCEDFNIEDNFLNGGHFTIYLRRTNRTLIQGNNIPGATGNGVYLGRTNDIEIRNNSFIDNRRGISLDDSNDISIAGNNFSSTERGSAISVEDSSNINITENICSDLQNGIDIDGSNMTFVFNNIFLNIDRNPLRVDRSANINISFNQMSSITVHTSDNIHIIGNSIVNGSSIFLTDCANNNVSFNLLNWSRDIRLTRVNDSIIWQNRILFSESFGIWMSESSRNHIIQNTISNAETGFRAFAITANAIERNSLSHNERNGISIENSTGNSIIWNNITDNDIGILLEDTDNNRFHHNQIIMNGEQLRLLGDNQNTWDDGQGEGNFWDDYPGFDTNGDGVGDTDLPHLGIDNFPLTNRERFGFDETLVFLIIYFMVLIITLLVVIYVYKKRKSKGGSEGGIEGVRPREL